MDSLREDIAEMRADLGRWWAVKVLALLLLASAAFYGGTVILFNVAG